MLSLVNGLTLILLFMFFMFFKFNIFLSSARGWETLLWIVLVVSYSHVGHSLSSVVILWFINTYERWAFAWEVFCEQLNSLLISLLVQTLRSGVYFMHVLIFWANNSLCCVIMAEPTCWVDCQIFGWEASGR